MSYQNNVVQALPMVSQFCAQTAVCPPQVLVIDRPNGPANVLVDTISLLLDREVSVTWVEDHHDALRALDYYHFDIVIVGLEDQQPVQLTVLPPVHNLRPDVAVVVVGRELPTIYKQYARTYGACEVLNMPERAADLKRLVERMATQYLQPNRAANQAAIAC